MDLWQLQIFCKVIELKSFSKAGESVRLSQSTVSSHIRDLEQYFNCRLIDRLAREAVPTKAGELLYRYARRLAALRQEAETALAAFQGQMKGRLVIGGSTIPGAYLLPRIIGRFRDKYPQVVVSLVIADTEEIIDATLAGELAFAIVGARTGNQKISQELLMDDEMRLIVPAGHKWSRKKEVELDLLLKEPFIVRESGSGTLKSIQQSLHSKHKSMNEFNIVAEMGSTTAVCQAIKGGVGVSIVSSIAVSEELEAGTLKALEVVGLDLKRSFYLTLARNRSRSPLDNTFIEHVRACLQRDKENLAA